MDTTNMWDFPMPVATSSYIWPAPSAPQTQLKAEPSHSLHLPGNNPEKHTAKLVRALESPVAYIDGDPSSGDDLELYYYRFVRFLKLLTTNNSIFVLRSPDQQPYSELKA